MTHDYKKARAILKEHNAWRRGESQNGCEPKDIGVAIDVAIKALELAIALQPKPISEVNHSEYVLGVDFKGDFNICQKSSDMFIDYDLRMIKPTHFYDISALPKPEVTE